MHSFIVHRLRWDSKNLTTELTGFKPVHILEIDNVFDSTGQRNLSADNGT